ncbi:hypothetical protein CYY_009644 [Polysphondylium violaceum]|uniref:DUF985 domain-containing protein n=1 Tax=Polysphondylium violaceum TaxID=133409 RepID=A0A8J4PLB8_9MYCE|nr:hypothetical protein CYY_009644 [Polysphondylium violaceum]
MNTKEYWIEKLKLVPHFEGGYYRETIKSKELVKVGDKPEKKLFSCIYFLMDVSDSACFHSVKCDEMWYFHYGSCLNVHCLKPDGSYELVRLGNNPDNGEVFQSCIQSNNIFGAAVEKDSEFGFAIASIQVMPGFDMSDFKLYPRSKLLEMFTDQKTIINQMAQEDPSMNQEKPLPISE